MPFNPLTTITGSNGTNTVQSAIAFASQRTGVDFHYLMGQAQLESGMRADARAPTSSASGLYQFVEQSWLRVVKQHGAEHGLDWAANAISVSGGKASVADPATRRAILDLRNNPQVASLMAAEHASDNKTAIESALGRDANGTDLYMAHFLGLGGARSFLTAMTNNPERSGAAMFPAAARANHSIFFNKSGAARSLGEIYNRFAARLDTGTSAALPAYHLASATIGNGGSEVIPGTGETSTTNAVAWAQSTLDRLNGGARTQSASLLRPTPDNARLAYLMLASLGA